MGTWINGAFITVFNLGTEVGKTLTRNAYTIQQLQKQIKDFQDEIDNPTPDRVGEKPCCGSCKEDKVAE